MKIAMQGHPTRGKEVIQILESLGGINNALLNGSKEYWYFINSDGYIRKDYKSVLQYKGFKTYTLEEFDKKFPFKIGDKVFLGEDNEYLYTIKSISIWHDGDIVYELVENELHYTTDKLTLYKEMKEERNITLTLEKAKEWYKKGGELKEIALQAFTERELNPLPRSWEEFCEKYPIKPSEAVICTESTIVTCNCSEIRDSDGDREVCPSKKSAEAHLAMIQLEQLRNCWRQCWKPDWNDYQQAKHCVIHYQEFKITTRYGTKRFLSFPTREIAEEFLKCFGDLIEKAGDLI